jgi:hypothetical protein
MLPSQASPPLPFVPPAPPGTALAAMLPRPRRVHASPRGLHASRPTACCDPTPAQPVAVAIEADSQASQLYTAPHPRTPYPRPLMHPHPPPHHTHERPVSHVLRAGCTPKNLEP